LSNIKGNQVDASFSQLGTIQGKEEALCKRAVLALSSALPGPGAYVTERADHICDFGRG
jgi:hypothetical protein